MKKIQGIWLTIVPSDTHYDFFRCECRIRVDHGGKTLIHSYENIYEVDNFESLWQQFMKRATFEIEAALRAVKE